MDMMSGIAKTSMELASNRVATEAQVSVLKQVMDVQKESMAQLLEAFGMGANMNIQG